MAIGQHGMLFGRTAQLPERLELFDGVLPPAQPVGAQAHGVLARPARSGASFTTGALSPIAWHRLEPLGLKGAWPHRPSASASRFLRPSAGPSEPGQWPPPRGQRAAPLEGRAGVGGCGAPCPDARLLTPPFHGWRPRLGGPRRRRSRSARRRSAFLRWRVPSSRRRYSSLGPAALVWLGLRARRRSSVPLAPERPSRRGPAHSGSSGNGLLGWSASRLGVFDPVLVERRPLAARPCWAPSPHGRLVAARAGHSCTSPAVAVIRCRVAPLPRLLCRPLARSRRRPARAPTIGLGPRVPAPSPRTSRSQSARANAWPDEAQACNEARNTKTVGHGSACFARSEGATWGPILPTACCVGDCPNATSAATQRRNDGDRQNDDRAPHDAGPVALRNPAASYSPRA